MRHSFDHYEDVQLQPADLLAGGLRVARAALTFFLPPWLPGLSIDVLNDAQGETMMVVPKVGEFVKLLGDSGSNASAGEGCSATFTAGNRRGTWVAESFSGDWDIS